MDSSTIIKSWKETPAIRAEFGNDVKRYIAYCDASNRGLVKICGTTVL